MRVLRDVATTLRTGAAEEPEALLTGHLTRPLEPTGFAAMAGAALPAGRETRAAPKKSAAAGKARVEKARKDVDLARRDVRRTEAAADGAEREARRLRGEAEQAAKRLAGCRAEAGRGARALKASSALSEQEQRSRQSFCPWGHRVTGPHGRGQSDNEGGRLRGVARRVRPGRSNRGIVGSGSGVRDAVRSAWRGGLRDLEHRGARCRRRPAHLVARLMRKEKACTSVLERCS